MKKVVATLCLITKDDEILLGMKKRGFGEGRWNGFGGKVSEGESIAAAALRELKEESGIEALGHRKKAEFLFTFKDKNWSMEVHVFHITDYQGEPMESEEMLPRWFKLEDIPYDEMWDDDKHWVPLFIAGKNLLGNFHFDENDKVLSYELNEVESLD